MGRPLVGEEGGVNGLAAASELLHDHNFSGHRHSTSSLIIMNRPMELIIWKKNEPSSGGSQQALLQEIMERSSSTGLRLREVVSEILKRMKEREFCSCEKQNTDGCFNCLRRRVVGVLCDRGFTASLCVSKWNRTNKFPVIAITQGRKKQVRVLIELAFRDQFVIAKACDEYWKLVSLLPNYYIGKSEYLQAMVGVLCDAAKRSMKERNLHMGPWRKSSFMQMKWLSSIVSDKLSLSDTRGQH